jgi:hypothetical protein
MVATAETGAGATAAPATGSAHTTARPTAGPANDATGEPPGATTTSGANIQGYDRKQWQQVHIEGIE